MPPLRSDRAPRACEACRRLKTRCYPSKRGASSCLRCETQNQDCSLKKSSSQNSRVPNLVVNAEVPGDVLTSSSTRIEERLAKLETLVHTLVDQVNALTHQGHGQVESRATSLEGVRSTPSADQRDAPVLLIKHIAENVFTGNRKSTDAPGDNSDPIENGIILIEDAYELLDLFRVHYGRWVNFNDELPIEQLMIGVRTSSLLFYSVCLVAARHTTQQRVNSLAPIFFREAKRLLQASILTTPQPLEFFQAALLLSLWSTTIGQVPLSIDSWLLTSYTLQQGLISSISMSVKGMPVDSRRLRACCTWNHICLAHLQYCVGTGRKTLLQEAQIDRCADVLEFEVSQFEVRMVAELKLYWIMVTRCCASIVNLSTIRTTLHAWKKEWSFLFDQPRSQFLEMGYNFALLLALCRSLHTQPSKFSRSKLNEMVQRAQDIINLAKTHTDERTPHLTDHIYHIITFSAITLCQLVTKYSSILIELHATILLQDVVLGLVDWLSSIGPTSHVSRVLAKIIEAHYAKHVAREDAESMHSTNRNVAVDVAMSQPSNESVMTLPSLPIVSDDVAANYPFQDLAWTTFFDFNVDTVAWPQSNELIGNNYTPTDEAWTVSTNATSP